jgi:hypothetical protein
MGSMKTNRAMRGIGACWMTAIVVLFIAGHMRGAERGLHPLRNMISQYAVSAPFGMLLEVVMIMFGVMLAALAFFLALGANGSRSRVLAALLLAGACVLAVLTAFHGTYPVSPPAVPNTRDWWTRTADWFRGARTPDHYLQGRLVAISGVHFVLIQSAIALILLAIGAISAHAWNRHQRFTAIASSVLLLFALAMFMAPRWHHAHGLWQRLGFMTILAWVSWQWRACAVRAREERVPESVTALGEASEARLPAGSS